MKRRMAAATLIPWPHDLNLGGKLQRLALLAPERVRAIEVLVDESLRDVWPVYKPQRRSTLKLLKRR